MSHRSKRWSVLRECVAVALALFALTLALQVASGAYACEFAAYPDEASHYISGLLVRDYAANGFPAPPMQYAKEYQAHYPKVAIGHWPPVFYLVQAGWTLLFTPSRTSILLLMALITAVLAALLYWRARQQLHPAAGLLASGLFVALPTVQTQTSLVMPENLVALFGFLAALSFGRYLESAHWRDSAWFAAYASLAIMTKGNGWAIVFVPPLAMLLTGRWRLAARLSFWMAPALIAVICMPWHVLTAGMLRHVWRPLAEQDFAVAFASKQTILCLVRMLGPVLLALTVLGLLMAYQRCRAAHRRITGEWAALAVLPLSVCLLSALVPLEVEDRKLMMAIPPLLLWAAASLFWLHQRLSPAGRWVQAWPVVAALAIFFVQTFSIPAKQSRGFIAAAETALSQQSASQGVYLVSANATGEGAFISEVAMRDARPSRFVFRASKALATSAWDGSDYKLLYRTPEEVRRYLNEHSITLIALEHLPAMRRKPHHILLSRFVREHPEEWMPVPLIGRSEAAPTAIRLFRRVPVGASAAHSTATNQLSSRG